MQVIEKRRHDMENKDAFPYFGAWVKHKIKEAGVTFTSVSAHLKMTHTYFSEILNEDRPRDEKTRRTITNGLIELGIAEPSEAWTAAKIVPPGYAVVPIEEPRKLNLKRTLDSYEDFREQYYWLTDAEAELHWKSIISRKPQESTK